MRFYFIRLVWLVFILCGLLLALKGENDKIQTVIYIAWIVAGVINYLFSKDSLGHFIIAVFILTSLTGMVAYLSYYQSDLLQF